MYWRQLGHEVWRGVIEHDHDLQQRREFLGFCEVGRKKAPDGPTRNTYPCLLEEVLHEYNMDVGRRGK
jgi:hypothetical protein